MSKIDELLSRASDPDYDPTPTQGWCIGMLNRVREALESEAEMDVMRGEDIEDGT